MIQWVGISRSNRSGSNHFLRMRLRDGELIIQYWTINGDLREKNYVL